MLKRAMKSLLENKNKVESRHNYKYYAIVNVENGENVKSFMIDGITKRDVIFNAEEFVKHLSNSYIDSIHKY